MSDRRTTKRRRRFARDPGPQGPVVVGLETGGDHLGVAMWRLPVAVGQPVSAWRLLESSISHRGHRHASTLLPVLDAMLTRQELTAADVALIAVGRGPGGFTGVRVGMATALGLAIGAGGGAACVWPVDSLTVLACRAAGASAGGERELVAVPLVDARKSEVYGAAFRVPVTGPPEELMPAMVGPHDVVIAAARDAAPGSPAVIFGSGATTYQCASEVPAAWHVPDAADTARIAALAWEHAGRAAEAAPAFDPAYVRPSDAELAQQRA